MSSESRRNFLAASGTLLATTATLGSFAAQASSHGHMHHGSADGHAIDASTTDTCATCQYWGGMRKISKDKKQVFAQSMGWCNNPNSMNHQKLTMADHKMKKTGIWKKWGALG